MTTLAVEGGWAVGALVGGPIWILLLIVGIAFSAYFIVDPDERGFGLTFLAGVLVVVGIGGAVFLWPFQKEYHYWTPTSGVVESVDKRLVADGEGMSEKIVVRFEGDPQQYGITDTRAALLREGDTANLLCKRSHQFGPSVDGYDCRWGGE